MAVPGQNPGSRRIEFFDVAFHIYNVGDDNLNSRSVCPKLRMFWRIFCPPSYDIDGGRGSGSCVGILFLVAFGCKEKQIFLCLNMNSFKKEIIYESSQVHFINHEIRRNFRSLSNGK